MASVSSGRPVAARSARLMTRAVVASAENAICGFSTTGVTGAGSGVTALALTAITGVPRTTVDSTV